MVTESIDRRKDQRSSKKRPESVSTSPLKLSQR